MKIGICDSGLGGLIVAQAIKKHMPQYDYVYIGDTRHLPYGQRSSTLVHELTLNMINFLFDQDCKLVIIACNTACAVALRKIQQDYLPRHYPDRNVLGVIVPMLETIHESGSQKAALIGTEGMVKTKTYTQELAKISCIKLDEFATPLLVPLIENDGEFLIEQAVDHYGHDYNLRGYDSIILGCTHYALIKDQVRQAVGKNIPVLSQDDIIPRKLEQYLAKHHKMEKALSKGGQIDFFVTDYTSRYQQAANKLFGTDIKLQEVPS